MRKLYENFHIFHFQKRIVSTETIPGNTVNTDHRNIITGAPKFVNLPPFLQCSVGSVAEFDTVWYVFITVGCFNIFRSTGGFSKYTLLCYKCSTNFCLLISCPKTQTTSKLREPCNFPADKSTSFTIEI